MQVRKRCTWLLTSANMDWI